jgi:predicted O-methyltransferase YrrM
LNAKNEILQGCTMNYSIKSYHLSNHSNCNTEFSELTPVSSQAKMNIADSIFRTVKFAAYKSKAVNAHSLHSPFLYDLYMNVIRNAAHYYAYNKVESVRAKMQLSDSKINVKDFGTGSSNGKNRDLPLSYIASHYVKPKKYGQLLFRLVNYFKPETILEIGTSLGITTLYLALPEKASTVITLEGSEETAAQAKENFHELGVNNIELITGEFSKSLPKALNKSTRLDFIYFDGNHRLKPTLDYFHQCLGAHHEQSVFVFDDIYWSREMALAWEEIIKNEAVTLSIDLYSIGVVFFRKGLPKQHFMLQF